MATTRDSAFYAAMFTNLYLADSRKYRGNVVPLPFEFTIVSVSATADIYRLTVIPANARVIDLQVTAEAMGASAGVGSMFIGDSGDTDRYMAQTDLHLINAHGTLAAAGSGYTPTADTIVYVTMVGANTVGKKVSGVIYVIPGG